MDKSRELNPETLRLLHSGEWMNGFTDDVAPALMETADLCFRLNALSPKMKSEREELVKEIFGDIGASFTVHSPFRCDFGFNIHVGDNFVANFNLTILDEAEVRIGNNVFIGPNTTICTVIHAPLPTDRNVGIMQAKPVVIGNNVWIAANVVILPGVTIGDGAVIGAGSVVTKDVAPFMLAVGNPCRPLRDVREPRQ